MGYCCNNVLDFPSYIAHDLSNRSTKHFAHKAKIQLRNKNLSALILINAYLDRHEGGDFLIAIVCQDAGGMTWITDCDAANPGSSPHGHFP